MNVSKREHVLHDDDDDDDDNDDNEKCLSIKCILTNIQTTTKHTHKLLNKKYKYLFKVCVKFP